MGDLTFIYLPLTGAKSCQQKITKLKVSKTIAICQRTEKAKNNEPARHGVDKNRPKTKEK